MFKEMIKKWKNDKQKFTFMIVPHKGGIINSLNFSIKSIKYFLIACLILIMLCLGAFTHYRYVVNKANAERDELQQLRIAHQIDVEEMAKLQQLTLELQNKISELNKFDKQIKNIIGE